MPTIVKAKQSSDFLALVPQLVGFQPRDSIVLVAFRGNRTCAAMRFDLPQDCSTTTRKRIATSLVGMLCKVPGADAVVPVAYTDDRFAGGEDVPHADFVRAVVRCAQRSGFVVRGAFCVAADAWGSYLGSGPPNGKPLQDIASSAVTAAIPEADRIRPGDLLDAARLPDVDAASRDEVSRLYLGLCDARPVGSVLSDVLREGGSDDPDDASGDEVPLGLCGAIELTLGIDPAAVSARSTAVVLWFLQFPLVRNAVLVQFAFGLEAGSHAMLAESRRLDGDDSWAEATIERLLGEGPRPDPGRIERAIRLLKLITARAPELARPAPLCMLSWLNWALGRGSVAGVFVDQALAIDPEDGLAALLIPLLDGGRLPEWAFRQDS